MAEVFPYEAESFDYTALITAICFVDNEQQAIKEAYHVLKKEQVVNASHMKPYLLGLVHFKKLVTINLFGSRQPPHYSG